MHRARFSLYYVVAYLLTAGFGLLFAPGAFLRLMLSTGDYGDIFPRFAGSLLLGLALVVIRLIQFRAEALYSTTLWIRALIVATLLWLYVHSGDPFFAAVLGIVGAGMLFTGWSLWRARRGA